MLASAVPLDILSLENVISTMSQGKWFISHTTLKLQLFSQNLAKISKYIYIFFKIGPYKTYFDIKICTFMEQNSISNLQELENR